MSSIHGLEKSAVSAHLYPIACVFPCCRMMIWGELETILSFLTLSEIYKGIGCASRAGCLAYERECNIRIGEHNRVLARYCTRSDWQTTLDKMGVIVSYPRSGNTFMRLLMEQTSGLCTGSDSRPNRNLAASLLRSGFRGEGIVDSR